MSQPRTYLDHNATAPLRPAARDAMVAALDVMGNPSSVHAEGRRARHLVETAREQVASLVKAEPAEVVFTSGAAEANAWVLGSAWEHVLVSRLEHETVLAALNRPGVEIFDVPAAPSGLVRSDSIGDRVLKGPRLGRALIALQLANNETGVVQPVAEVAGFANEHRLAVHCDAVQAIGRMPVDFGALGVTTMSLSAHKIGGPKGAGALVIRDGTALPPLIPGGQERRRRGGTENVAAIAGFGAAAVEAAATIGQMSNVEALRDRLEQELRAIAPDTCVVGADVPRLPNTSCFAIPGQRAETLVIRLDMMGFAVSAGAACSSGKVGASHVLAAMGVDPAIARGAIRVSLGCETTETDIKAFLAAIAEIVSEQERRARKLG